MYSSGFYSNNNNNNTNNSSGFYSNNNNNSNSNNSNSNSTNLGGFYTTKEKKKTEKELLQEKVQKELNKINIENNNTINDLLEMQTKLKFRSKEIQDNFDSLKLDKEKCEKSILTLQTKENELDTFIRKNINWKNNHIRS